MKVLLLDLPVFPKGTIALSLFSVASLLKSEYNIVYLDLNFENDKNLFYEYDYSSTIFVGLKVSAQNFETAKSVTAHLKKKHPKIIVLWGGELPTLLPNECLQYADTIVSGLFEPVAENLMNDLRGNTLKKIYKGNNVSLNGFPSPDISLIKEFNRYNTFMGLPLETSRGCSERCTFCMVLVMQRQNYYLKNSEQLKKELQSYRGKFVNVVDYNFGVNREHVISFSGLIKKSGCLGWMAEMNIEFLDDDEMLGAMRESNCKMIYCGLESIKEEALASVNKSETNTVADYERIIRKVQSYNIHVAAGLILGLDKMTEDDYKRTYSFFSNMGIIYTKLTFLTFNPGTRIKDRMAAEGTFITEKIEHFDGNHPTYLPLEIDKNQLINIAEWYIHNYYSLINIIMRALKSHVNLLSKVEMIFFAFCYREPYLKLIKSGALNNEQAFDVLLNSTYKKTRIHIVSEKILFVLQKISVIKNRIKFG